MVECREGDTRCRLIRVDIPAALALFVLVLVLFLPSLGYGFLNWDDHEYIHRNPWLLNTSLWHLSGIFQHFYFSNYHPLTLLSYKVDFALFGYDAWGYRLHNVILHGLCSVVFFAILRSFSMGTLLSLFLAGFFALHPLRLESVVWISERKDVLCALFYLLSFYFWRLSVLGEERGRNRWLVALSLCAAALAFLSKAMAVTLPVVILLHDIALARKHVKGRIPVHAVLFLAAFLFGWLNMEAQGGAIKEAPGLPERLNLAAWAPLHYTSTTLFPVGLSPLYPYAERPSANPSYAASGWLFSIGALALVVHFWRRRPVLAFGLLASAVVLAPVSGIIPFGAAYAADRYSYLPTVFVLIGVGHLLEAFFRRIPPPAARALLPIGVPIVSVYAGIALWIMPMWENSETLWRRVLDVYPSDGKAQYNLAHARETTTGREPAAAIELDWDPEAADRLAVFRAMREGRHEEAVEIAGRIPDPAEGAYWSLRAARDAGRWEWGAGAAEALASMDHVRAEYLAEAAASFLENGAPGRAVELLSSLDEPTFMGALVWARLARDAFLRNDAAAGLAHGRKALLLNPAEAVAVREMHRHYRATGNEARAARVLRRAARHPAASARVRVYALTHLGLAHESSGGDPSAFYQRAFAVPPPDGATRAERAAHFHYVATMAELAGEAGHAARLYREALTQDEEHPDALQGLAILYATSGRLERAEELLLRAREFHPLDTTIRENLRILRTEMRRAGLRPAEDQGAGDHQPPAEGSGQGAGNPP